MANTILQLVGFILSTIALICILISTFVPEWRRNDPSGVVLQSIVRHQGIWVRCVAYPTGQWQCDDYDAFFLGLPAQLQVARGLSVSACILGFLGFIISLVGMQCTNCLSDSPRMKSRVSMVGAICFAVAGLSIGAAVSYYANQVLSEYHRDILLFPDDAGQRYIYGACLFVGWAALCLAFLGSLVAACGSLPDDEEDGVRRSAYRPSGYGGGYKASNNTEYV